MNLITNQNKELKIQKSGLFSRFKGLLNKDKVMKPNSEDLYDAKDIIESLNNAKNDWINANLNFEYADNEEMIDYYIYKIKACQVRYEYFLRKAKDNGIKIETFSLKDNTFSNSTSKMNSEL